MTHHSSHERDLIAAFLARHAIDASDPDAALLELAQIVAGIPWGEGRTATDTLEHGMGTCTGKHRVLLAALEECGVECRPVVCTFHWQEQEIAYPKELKDFLEGHHWPHSHTFIQVKNGRDAWIDLDVTWDPGLKPYGFWILPGEWDGEHSFHGLKFLERWDGADIASKQDELSNLLTDEQRHDRDHFRGAFVQWIQSLR